MQWTVLLSATTVTLLSCSAFVHAANRDGLVSDQVIAQQRQALNDNTKGQGFGPQSPRDIDLISGRNPITFQGAPAYSQMNLCNIHFHKNAEHKGGEFTKFAGNGDGQGYLGGYQYSGQLTAAELAPVDHEICPSNHGGLHPGDTIELHYVYSTAQVTPGASLGSCFNDGIKNPQLRVEAQVYVLVNDNRGADFIEITQHAKKNGLQQALNVPSNTGQPVQYAGSTTGPTYNEKGSPFQVTWGVRPNVSKVNIASVGAWCESNDFEEDHAHGVRNLVINPDLLSPIK
ncbi:MAG: delta-class carbonic anhydrase [Marinomonas sp.]